MVNINIWLTGDDSNLDVTSGGLVVYDKGPCLEDMFVPEKFDFWNNFIYEENRLEWLVANDSKNVTVTYRENRAVIFDSNRLHATDKYNFKRGYLNRRINLTLLFGTVGTQRVMKNVVEEF